MMWILPSCIWVDANEVADKRTSLEPADDSGTTPTDDSGTTPDDTGTTKPIDEDGDGFSPPEDCDDSDGDIHPDAVEIIGDDVDSNCDTVLNQFPDVQEFTGHSGPTEVVARTTPFGPMMAWGAEVTRVGTTTYSDTVNGLVLDEDDPAIDTALGVLQYYFEDQAVMEPSFDAAAGYQGADYILYLSQQTNASRRLVYDIQWGGATWDYLDVADTGQVFEDIDLLVDGTNVKTTACVGLDVQRLVGSLTDITISGSLTRVNLSGASLDRCKTTSVGVFGGDDNTPPTFYQLDGTKLTAHDSTSLLTGTTDLDLVETGAGLHFAAIENDGNISNIVVGTSADGLSIVDKTAVALAEVGQSIALAVTPDGNPVACITTPDEVYLATHEDGVLVVDNVTGDITAPRSCAVYATDDHLILAVTEGSSRIVGAVAPYQGLQ